MAALRLRSDGTAAGFQLLDSDGKPIYGVTSARWVQEGPDSPARLHLTFEIVPAELQGEPGNVEYVCAICKETLDHRCPNVVSRHQGDAKHG